ncbi:uncharacterized protein LOC108087417 [Drosophila ficusphila]|uniref:uncharacterized protein LOC108087417 n=1 Tax=Drosophila ficusphila TaxID=30025 RepID=UPI0007E6060D|nr:uncharacterized protein LOC108087417 [Drosophila ficusphila]
MGKSSLLILGILALIAIREVANTKPGPCRKLKQQFPPTKMQGKMLLRSMYLNSFDTVSTFQPSNLCIRYDVAAPELKDYTVIGTDNKDYVVLYKCNYFNVSKTHIEFINAYTSVKTPSPAVLNGISLAYKKNGLDEKLIMTLCQ